ncbi:MAG: FadD3 family acyl-CoA ligase [Pseudomonadota bacterium]
MSLLPPIPTIPRAFAQTVSRHPDHSAIEERGVRTSYAELDRMVLAASRALMAWGIAPGERVAIWAPNCREWIVAALGILGVGAVVVPVNTRMKGLEVGYVLEKSGARLLLSTGDFLGVHYPDLLAGHLPASLEKILVIHGAKDSDTGWQDFIARGESVSEAAARERALSVTPEMVSDVIFTSGTTGHPKGVKCGHGQNLRTMDDWSQVMGLVPQDRYLMVNPFFHSMGYKSGWMVGIMNGLTLMPVAVFDAGEVLRTIARDKVSVLPGPPTIYYSMLSHPDFAATDLSSLRAAITGSTSTPPSLIESMRRDFGFKTVLTGYGLSECCGTAALSAPDDDAHTVATTAGRAIRDVEIRIVDADGRPQPPDQPGEVLIRGYNVMLGYLDDEGATQQTIDADGWLHSGDIGTLDAHGYLRITDRVKDVYIAGGFNCYPAEIERLASRHPAVSQIAVIGVPDERMGEVGRAFVVRKPGVPLESGEFVTWCRAHMANYKVPQFIDFVETLPTNASGKVLKRELRKLPVASGH